MEKLIKECAYNLWLKYDKPENRDFDIWLEAEKYIESKSICYSNDFRHNGKGANFITLELNTKLKVILTSQNETSNYRKNDILMIKSNYYRYYNYLFIRIKEVDYQGKILDYYWKNGYINKNYKFTKLPVDNKKFGDISREAIYVGYLKNNEVVKSDSFYINGNLYTDVKDTNIIKLWNNNKTNKLI